MKSPARKVEPPLPTDEESGEVTDADETAPPPPAGEQSGASREPEEEQHDSGHGAVHSSNEVWKEVA